MKLKLLLALLVMNQMLYAQTIEPNLKWGKPTDAELKMTEYADDKDADAVVLYHKTDVYYNFVNGDFKVYYDVRTRLKVLKPDGKRVADKSINYVENENNRMRKEVITGLKAVAYNLENDKLVKTKMEQSMVHRERLDKNMKQLKFSVPQVKVGTVIEYEFCLESDIYYDIYSWYAQSDIPVLYTCYNLAIPEWLGFNIEETGGWPMEKKLDGGSLKLTAGNASEFVTTKEYHFNANHLPALKQDGYVWCTENYGNKVTAELRGIYIPGAIQKNYTSTWADINVQLLEDNDFGGRLKNSSPLKADIVAAGIPDIADKRERFAAVWKMLKSKVRWNGDYAFWGKSASKVLKEGTGTNADINFLLINMLHDANIDAVPVVLRTRDRGFLPLTHASLKFLNTFVVAIHTDESRWDYFDASAEDGYLNTLPAILLVERARILDKDGQGDWVDLMAVANSKEASSIQVTLSADGVLDGTRRRLLNDEAAALFRKKWREAKDSMELIHQLQEKSGMEIKTYQIAGRNDFSSQAVETVGFTKQCDTTGDVIFLNPLVFAPLSESPFTAAERRLPIEFPFKQTESVNVVISLPEGYGVEDMPKPVVLKYDGMTVRIGTRVSDGILTTQFLFRIDKTFFPVETYQDVKAFLDKLAECCKSMVTIKKMV